MNTRILWTTVAVIFFFFIYTFAVPALLSTDSALCVLFGTLILVIPVAGAVIYFIELYKETHDGQQ